MKITNKKVLATVVISSVALAVISKSSADLVTSMMSAGSYIAVAILYALAALDYRIGTKNYSAR